MADFPSSQSQSAEAVALIQSIRSLKQSATERATAFGIVSSISADVITEASRNNVVIGQSTKDRLELAESIIDPTSKATFQATSLEVDSKLANANALLSEITAKLAGRL